MLNEQYASFNYISAILHIYLRFREKSNLIGWAAYDMCLQQPVRFSLQWISYLQAFTVAETLSLSKGPWTVVRGMSRISQVAIEAPNTVTWTAIIKSLDTHASLYLYYD